MTDKKELKKSYKLNPPKAGIYCIKNKTNGKIFVGKGLNVDGIINSQLSQLKWGGHKNKQLQKEWQQFGDEQFSFEVLDYLENKNDPQQDLPTELATLEELWLQKLAPYGEKGYNEPSAKKK
jgi:hypothetical protein